MEERKIALFDMDGVLVDYHETLVKDMKKLMSPKEKMINIMNNKRRPDYIEARKQLIISRPEWWINLPPLDMGISLLKFCEKIGFEIGILTKGPTKSTVAWSAKVDWIKKNLGYLPEMVITTDKSLVYGRVLVDDYPEYALSWLKHRPRGLVLMPKNKVTSKLKNKNILTYETDCLFDPIRTQHKIINALIKSYER